jgi:hypothetical protein
MCARIIGDLELTPQVEYGKRGQVRQLVTPTALFKNVVDMADIAPLLSRITCTSLDLHLLS